MERPPSEAPMPFRWLRIPPAWLFGGLVAFKNLLYDKGVLPVHRLDRPVISVGNLAMGGTGKTPVTSELVGRLEQGGLKVAVLSRGYVRRDPKATHRVDPDGDWTLYGDEPTMLARRHRSCWVCVGPSRREAAQAASSFEPDIFVVDDGFQHRQLHRDLDLVLLNATGPLPALFPLAHYREGWRGLARADAAILTRASQSGSPQTWMTQIRARYPKLPVHDLDFQPGELVPLEKGPHRPLSDLAGKRIAAYTGIAKPQLFFRQLEDLGAEIVVKYALKDHEPLTNHHRDRFLESCRQADAMWILTTEKDAVKLDPKRGFGVSLFFLTQIVSWGDKRTLDSLLKPFVD